MISLVDIEVSISGNHFFRLENGLYNKIHIKMYPVGNKPMSYDILLVIKVSLLGGGLLLVVERILSILSTHLGGSGLKFATM